MSKRKFKKRNEKISGKSLYYSSIRYKKYKASWEDLSEEERALWEDIAIDEIREDPLPSLVSLYTREQGFNPVGLIFKLIKQMQLEEWIEQGFLSLEDGEFVKMIYHSRKAGGWE